MATGNISRKTYENRTQVDIPFSSVPIVSPTVTAGRGAVVGPAQVQPSKLVSLSNALGVATDIIPTVTAIKGLEKQQGLRAGELAAKAEIDAKDAFSKMEQAGRKAVEAGTLKESQLPSFQFAFKDGIAKRAAGDYNSLLVSQLKRVNENLENGRNGAEYAQELTTEAYEQFAERFNDDPIMLQSFNTAIQGYNRNFSEQVIRARDKALKDNHIKNVTSSNINEIEAIINTEELPDELIGDMFSVPATGLTEAESTKVAMGSVASAYYNLTDGEPTEQKYNKAKRLLDEVARAKTKSGIPILNLEDEGSTYHSLRAQLNRYKNLTETTAAYKSKKLEKQISNKLHVHIGNYVADKNNAGLHSVKIIEELKSIFGEDAITDEEFEQYIVNLNRGTADSIYLDWVNRSDILSEEEKETLLVMNTRIDDLALQKRRVNANAEQVEAIIQEGIQLISQGQTPNLVSLGNQFGVQLDPDQAQQATDRFAIEQRKYIGTTIANDSDTINLVSDFQSSVKESSIRTVVNSEISRGSDQTAAEIQNAFRSRSTAMLEIDLDFKRAVDESIKSKVQTFYQENERDPNIEELDDIRLQAIEANKENFENQYKILESEVSLDLTKVGAITTNFIKRKNDNILEITQDLPPAEFFDVGDNKNKKENISNTNRDYLLRITNNVPVRFGGQFKNVDLTEKQIKDIRREIGYESPADIPKQTKAGDVDWRTTFLFSTAAWKGENSIWNYDNEGSVLRLAEAEFEKLEGSAPKKDETPHAYFWANTFGIRTPTRFREMLFAQRDLYDAYQVRDRNTVDPQRKQLQADIDQQASEIQRFGRGTRIGIEPSRIDSASSEFEAFRETAPVSSRLQEKRDALELKRRQSFYLDNVYNQNIEYYKIFNK